MSKVLLWSPPLWARTAYSKDMLNLALELMKAGHDVKNFALTGLAFSRVDYPVLECPECGYKIPGKYEAEDCPRCGASNWQRYIIDVLPNNSRDYGQSWLPKWNMLLGPFDLIILHYDAWVMGGYKPPGDIRLAYYSPVDHSPCPPPLANVLKAENVMVIVMSRFGQKELKKAGISSIYIPHTVDTKMFSPSDRTEARKRLELPEDSCLFAAICTNKGPRKNWGNLLRAFRDFLDQVPRARDNSFLFAHTNITASEDNPRGFNLAEIWHSLGIEERIKHTHPIYYEAVGFTDEEMCDVYRSADWTLLCMPAKQQVITPKGFRNIKSINVGDYVFTHNSIAKRVRHKLSRPYSGDLITIKVLGGYKLTVTPDHPILCVESGSKMRTFADKPRYEWRKAKSVKTRDLVFVIQPNPSSYTEVYWGGKTGYPKRLQIPKNTSKTRLRESDHILPKYVTVDTDLMRLIGYYLAEGTADIDGGNGLIFSLNAKEAAIASDIKEIIKAKFNIDSSVRIKDSKCWVTAYSKRLAILFRQLAGKGAYKKRLPRWVMNIRDQRRKTLHGLIRGMLLGDGSFDAKNGCIEYSTVSSTLAKDFSLFLMKMGFYPSLTHIRRLGRQEYQVRISGTQARKLAKLAGLDYNFRDISRTYRNSKKVRGGFLVPVVQVKRQSASKMKVPRVYNLSVEDDESFGTPIATHNCSLGEGFGLPIIESLASGTPVIYSDFSSCPEVVGQGGLPVKAIDRFPFELSSSFQWVPSTKQITKRLIQAYEDWENGGHLRDELAKKGRQHVLQNYTWNKVKPLWLDLIKPKVSRTVELLARNESVDGEVDIIVITHNKLHLLKNCIESIYQETKIPFHLVVVDDQSDDETPKHMRKLWRERGNVSYIRPQDKAKGGAQIMNIGLKYCRNDRIVSMNNDITVTDGWLKESIKVIEGDPTIGIVGMKFLYPDNKIQHAGGVFIKGGLPFHLGIGEPRQTHSEIKEVPWVSGPCVLLRRQCLEPGWNEDYDNFGGHEDIDLCLRARKEGWKVMYCGKSEVYHLEGESVMAMPNFWQMHIKSRQVFLSKWGNTPWVK